MSSEELPFIEVTGEVRQRPDGLWCARIIIASRNGEENETIEPGPFENRAAAERAIDQAVPLIEKMLDEAGGHIRGYRITVGGVPYGEIRERG